MRGGGLWQLGQALGRAARRHLATDSAPLKRTVLHDFHVENGGKMVPFAGWSMPIQYKDSIMDSTLNCRSHGSLFDVSHMCGLSLKGRDVVPFLETLVIADVASLKDGTGTLTVFTNDRGGAIDDSVITKVTDRHLYIVVNAGCRDKDLDHIGAHMEAFKKKGGDVEWHIHDERSLLALQGPLAAPVLQTLTKEDLSKLYFGEFRILDINGSQCYLTRTGTSTADEGMSHMKQGSTGLLGVSEEYPTSQHDFDPEQNKQLQLRQPDVQQSSKDKEILIGGNDPYAPMVRRTGALIIIDGLEKMQNLTKEVATPYPTEPQFFMPKYKEAEEG